uniref:Uncharacterized protein n=1 Tax=Triticum urartu TaxID=4572 RepID=A0A8R7K3K0_TRIUA
MVLSPFANQFLQIGPHGERSRCGRGCTRGVRRRAAGPRSTCVGGHTGVRCGVIGGVHDIELWRRRLAIGGHRGWHTFVGRAGGSSLGAAATCSGGVAGRKKTSYLGLYLRF